MDMAINSPTWKLVKDPEGQTESNWLQTGTK